jgi:ABC-type uncharacterized transport system ATPase subunit
MPPLLEVHDARKAFGGVTALDGVSLELSSGEMLCLIGPNGCGKTTLFNVITGAFAPDGGEVRFDGRPITGLPAHRIARVGISRKFQVPSIYPSLSVAENLEVPIAGVGNAWRPWRVMRSRQNGALGQFLDWCGLAGKATQQAGTLSHGEKQWLEIAMQLAADPTLLLLDEPTAGMSMTETEKTADLIRQMLVATRKSILVIEHDMTFVQRLDSAVAVMLRGRVVKTGRFADIRADPQVIEAYLGAPEAC